jgi:hypothetical protein
MVLFALSFQGQVEKYGVYVGIAAFFGLAVLSLLYFSQARELKRLREWAGRAPERARELEQRVVAQAAANVARRTPSMPGAPKTQGTIAPPRRLAEMPVPPPGAQTAAGAQATELAEAVEADEPATNGNVPAPPAAGAANGALPPAEDAQQASGDGVGPAEGREEPSEEGAEAAGDEATGEEAKKDKAPGDEAQPAAAEGAEAEPASEEARPEPASEEARPEPASEEARPEGQPEPEPQRMVAARPGEVPAAVPRATPAQRVGVTPRPAPLPLRQTRPSATPAGGRGGKRPAAPAPRRSAGTVALFVGLAVLVLGGGAFAVSQLGGDDTPPAPNRAAPPPNQPETGGTGATGSEEPAKTAAETNVAVLNGTTFTGLAGQLADRVSQEGGYERGATETNTRDQTIQTSTVFYADGFRSQARKVAELLSISAVEPVDEETQALAPDADVVVLAGADQAP